MPFAFSAALAVSVALFVAEAAHAESPPAPLACETADEVVARVHFERALRAMLDGRRDEARAEIRSGLAASPTGRFAQPTQELLAKVESAPARPVPPAGESSAGSRAEMITTASLYGGLLGGLTAGAVASNNDAKAYVGLIMLGTGVGLVGSIAATSGVNVRASTPPMFQLGGAYGVFASLLIADMNTPTGKATAGYAAVGLLGGSVAGIAFAEGLRLSGGDAGSAWTGFLYGASLPLMIEATGGTDDSHRGLYEWTALIGGTAGLVLMPIVNQRLHWSRTRWSLINLGGGVGTLMGLGTAVLASANTSGFFALMSAGTIVGLGVSAFATQGFDADEPSSSPSRALLDVDDKGKLRLGSLGEALQPAVIQGRAGKLEYGAALSILGARF